MFIHSFGVYFTLYFPLHLTFHNIDRKVKRFCWKYFLAVDRILVETDLILDIWQQQMGSHIEMTANSFQALGTDGLLQSSNFPIRFDLFENFKIFPLEVHAHLACPGHLSYPKRKCNVGKESKFKMEAGWLRLLWRGWRWRMIEKPTKKFQLGEGWRFARTQPGVSLRIKMDGDDDDGGADSYDDRADRGSPGMQRLQKIGILSGCCKHLRCCKQFS